MCCCNCQCGRGAQGQVQAAPPHSQPIETPQQYEARYKQAEQEKWAVVSQLYIGSPAPVGVP